MRDARDRRAGQRGCVVLVTRGDELVTVPKKGARFEVEAEVPRERVGGSGGGGGGVEGEDRSSLAGRRFAGAIVTEPGAGTRRSILAWGWS